MGFFDRFTSRKGKAEKAAPKKRADKISAEEAKKQAFKNVPTEKPAEPKGDVTVSTPKSTGDAYRVLLGGVVTEKSARLERMNQFVFSIAPNATKQMVAAAVKNVYGVRPESVQIIRLPGKWVRYGRTMGRQVNRKKAIVQLPAGKTIDVVSS